jgi:hypothetical protein
MVGGGGGIGVLLFMRSLPEEEGEEEQERNMRGGGGGGCMYRASVHVSRILHASGSRVSLGEGVMSAVCPYM